MGTTTSATLAYKSENRALMFSCFVLFGYSCICDAAWPCPPARPAPPIYGLKRCLAHIQYIDCKRQPVTHRGACLWCLHNRFRNSGRAHLKSLWTHRHTHRALLVWPTDGRKYYCPCSVRRLVFIFFHALSLLLCWVNGLEAPRSRWGCPCQTAYSLCTDSLLYSGACCVRQSQRCLFAWCVSILKFKLTRQGQMGSLIKDWGVEDDLYIKTEYHLPGDRRRAAGGVWAWSPNGARERGRERDSEW